MKQTGAIMRFPSAATHLYVQLDDRHRPTLAACVLPPTTQTINLKHTSDYDLWQRHCKKCPQFQSLEAMETVAFEGQNVEDYSWSDKFKLRLKHVGEHNTCPGVEQLDQCGYDSCPRGLAMETIKQARVKTPTLLWSINPIDGTQLYAIPDSSPEALEHALPYQLGNVFSHAEVCWGRNKKPTTLMEAHSLYWSSPFNGHIIHDYQHSLKFTYEHYDVFKAVKLSTGGEVLDLKRDLRPLLLKRADTTLLQRKKPATAAVLFTAEKLLTVVPEPYHLALGKLFGWAQFSPLEKTFYINFNGFLCRKKALTDSSAMTPIGHLQEVIP